MLYNSFSKEISPDIQSEPPLTQLEVISSHPISGYLGDETNTHLTTTAFQVVVESDEVSPQPPLLQSEQPQLEGLPQSRRRFLKSQPRNIMFVCKCRIHNLWFSICCIMVVVVVLLFTRPSGSVIYEERELCRSSAVVSTDSSCFGPVTTQINTLHLLCSFHC